MKFLINALMIGSLVALFVGCSNDLQTRAQKFGYTYNEHNAKCPLGTKGFRPHASSSSCDVFDESGTYIQTIGTYRDEVHDVHGVCHTKVAFVRCRDLKGYWLWPERTDEGVCPFQGDEAICPSVQVATIKTE